LELENGYEKSELDIGEIYEGDSWVRDFIERIGILENGIVGNNGNEERIFEERIRLWEMELENGYKRSEDLENVELRENDYVVRDFTEGIEKLILRLEKDKEI
jgi:hypothetical protein